MATFEKGDMWSIWENTALFLITTNSSIRTDGCLVMGRGIAKEARDRFPGLDRALGKMVWEYGDEYGLLLSESWPEKRLGVFQVKYHWKARADLYLIGLSTEMLAEWALEFQDLRADLNFPGIGNGGLDKRDVLPIVERLPDSVHIWTRE